MAQHAHVPERSGSMGSSLVTTTLSALVAPGPAISPFAAAAGAAVMPAETIAASSADSEGAEGTMQPPEELLSFNLIETAELQQLTQRLAALTAICRQHEVEAAVKDAELTRLRKLTSILQDDVDDLSDDCKLLGSIMANNKSVAIERMQDRLQEEAASELTCQHTRQLLLEADELLEQLAEKQKGIAVYSGRLDELRRQYRWAVDYINEHNAAAAAPGDIVHSWPICKLKMPSSCCEYAKQLNAKLRVKHQNPEWQLAALRKEFATANKKHAAALQEAKTAGVLQVAALCRSATYRQDEETYQRAVTSRQMQQKAKTTKAYDSGLRGFAASGVDGGQDLLQFGKVLPNSHLQRLRILARAELLSNGDSLMEPVVVANLQEDLAAAHLVIAQLKQELCNAEAEIRTWQAGQSVERDSDIAVDGC